MSDAWCASRSRGVDHEDWRNEIAARNTEVPLVLGLIPRLGVAAVAEQPRPAAHQFVDRSPRLVRMPVVHVVWCFGSTADAARGLGGFVGTAFDEAIAAFDWGVCLFRALRCMGRNAVVFVR